MKLLVFIDHMAFGGAARVTSIMCKELAERGYQVTLSCDCHKPILYDLGNKVQKIDNYVHRLGKSHFAGLLLLTQRVQRYKKIITAVQPDIVIGVEPEPYLYARIASIGKKNAVVAVDHITFGYTEQHWFTRWIRWHAYKWADKVSILSYVDNKILGKRLPQKIVVHNPISFDTYDKIVQRENIVLCVGRVDGWEQKGFDRMIRIWSKVTKIHPNWQLVIAGNGKEESFNYLKQIAREQANYDSIKFVGEVIDMQTLYQRASIFALPSRFEGFPMCLLEAASQGCACVAFDLQGISHEIFTDEKEGLIIPDNDEQLFADKINYLIDNPNVLKEYSKNGSKAMKRFSKEQFVETWEQICNSLVKE